jgi:glycosyltransferase involved in cell wall biosynthesis
VVVDGDANERRRILFILPDIDEPPTKGYQVRCLGLASGLSGRYVSRIVSARDAALVESVSADRRLIRRLQAFLAGLFDGRPLQSALFDGTDVMRLVSAIAAEWKPYAIVVVTERLPITMRALCGYPLFIDIVDSMRLHMEERAARAGFPVRWLWLRESRAFQRAAQRLTQCAERVIASSVTALADYPDALVIRNAANTDSNPRPIPAIDVIFTGNLSYWPNAKAARDLCEAIAPILRAALPQSRIVIAGRNPRADLRRACELAGVSLMANVDDISALLRSARLAVAPLPWTPAANLKIMEALAAGTPVLAYPAAVEHLPEAIDGVLVCEGPQELAHAAIAILEGRKTLSQPKREQHTWAARAAELEALLDAVLE